MGDNQANDLASATTDAAAAGTASTVRAGAKSRARRSRRPRARVLIAQGTVLALALGTISGFAYAHRSVVLDIDGQRTEVHGFATSVGDLLHSQGVTLGSHDTVAPSASAPIPSDGEVVVRRARQVTLTVDGKPHTIWTTARTVGEAVDDLGLRTADIATSSSRSARVTSGLRVVTAKPIEVVLDGRVIDGQTTGETVGAALKELGVNLSDTDVSSVPLDAPVAPGLAVVIDQPEFQTVTEETVFKHDTVEKKDPAKPKGTKTVTQKGRDGKQTVTYRVTKLGEKVIGKELLASVVTAEPKDEIVTIGTAKRDVIPAAPAVPSGTAQKIAAGMVKARGWDDSQFSCLVSLWNRESGWRTNAANPSGAYGIPQSLPGSKMGAYGSDWRTNPATQIAWGLAYIKGRYGTPCGAWSSFQSKGWY